MKKLISKKMLYRFINFYPPFIGAGVKVRVLNDECSELEVSMKLTRFNKNYVGTHFGGSLYSMCDPFYMLILMQHLGRDYLVWDKSASIDFRRPGRTKVKAHFKISKDRIKSIIDEVNELGKCEPIFNVDVLDENDKLVATIEKKLWVKKKS
ncbi:YiiD C-terminal domain-containing protein [Halobacteriovorax sp. GB3]|uniref:DUF4442 domain-containing protein n=1 Tax=Halobacteriovorax sp. GB3 TaxID=2719615 RepID=UPI00235DEE78|nr:DUF4442 domain-containing protein [Halobacteriovorax sp. GB3]MDD0853767.1 YiiD C-terminal domain-containing protein [Halobacteriovorax sp. GB3]